MHFMIGVCIQVYLKIPQMKHGKNKVLLHDDWNSF
jgi:hypothetical protein